MATVATLLGPVDTGELGVTLMHEHIMLVNPEIDANYPGWWDLDKDIPDATAMLRDLRAKGVGTVVDLTVLGLGRNVQLVKKIAEPAGINVIVATGAYYFDDLPFFFKNRGPGSFNGGDELLAEFFVRDIEQGIAGTGIRAAILKCATDAKGVTPDGDRILRAIARAHLQTGVPISTHTHAATRRGLDQQRIFKEEGVDLSRVIIGHCGDSADIAYLTGLMEAGSYIGMDRFGLDIYLPTPQRIETVVELVRRGYAERMVLSHDTSCITISYDQAPLEGKLPDWRFSFLLEKGVPMMLERGVSEDDIDQMLVRNPREIFERASTAPRQATAPLK